MHVVRPLRILLPFLPALVLVTLALLLTPASFAAPPRLPASIQAQVEAAPDGGTILVLPDHYYENVVINKNLTVTAQSYATTIVESPASRSVISVTAGHTVTLVNLTIMGGHPTAGVGGGVFVEAGSNLRISGCRIMANAAGYGGGVFSDGAGNRVDVIDSIILNNSATYHGGGLFVRGAAALTNTAVAYNTAGHHGGGLHTDVGRTDINGGAISYNSSGSNDNGGGVNVNNAITVSGTQFISNTAAQDGGAVLQWNAGQPVIITNARFERNGAQRDGGALWAHGNLTVTGSVFISNTADSHNTTNTHGGGLYLNGGTLTIISSTFTANKLGCVSCSQTLGGGAYLLPNGTGLVQGSRFEANYGWLGGGIGTSTGAVLSIQQSSFTANSAGYGGGMDVAEATVSDTDFTRNEASNSGGALQAGYTVVLTYVRFISNTTSGFQAAGAAWLGGSVQAVNVLFAGNRSLSSGAALWLHSAGTRTLRHVTLAYPGQGAGAAIRITGGTLNITNSIIASYSVGISNSGGIVEAPYDLFFGGIVEQLGPGGSTTIGPYTIYADPRFVNPAAGDYHLRADSPAIGAGANLGVATDLDGRPRANRFDLGAYQFWTSLFLPLIRR